MSWVIWGVLLLLQNAAFVANSRARNSASLRYHAVTNFCSNGVFIVSQFFAVDKILEVWNTHNLWLGALVFSFYVVLNLIGGLVTHHFLLKRSL